LRINPFIIFLVIIALFFAFNAMNPTGSGGRQISYSSFFELVEAGKIESVSITDNYLELRTKQQEELPLVNNRTATSSTFNTLIPGPEARDSELMPTLRKNNVAIRAQNPSPWLGLLSAFLPVLLMLGIFWFVFMRGQGAQGQVMQFGQSRVGTVFADVAGHEEVKRELIEVVDFLKNPGKYHAVGAEIPKGVLLVGPPGTGKTLLARAVAGEAGVPFFTVSASEFMEMFVGVGASRVRSLFDDARKASPAIIFIDELDSIGRKRGAGIGGGHDEREQTLNQILTEMDGFDKQTSVIIMAATNRPDILDNALLRPGRFDRQVTVDLPTMKEREQIVQVHMRNKPIDADVNVEMLSKMTPGMSGADLKNLANEAALEAARRGATMIKMADFSRAFDKITLGLEHGSMMISQEMKRSTAYHEAGHAVIAQVLPHAMKPVKVSIVPRGRTLGVAMYAPENESEMLEMTQQRAEATLAATLAGRAAEEEFIGYVGAGASNDFQRTLQLARRMVLEWGMGDRLRNIAWGGSNSGPVFLGEQLVNRSEVSDETARMIDADIKDILDRAYANTKAIMKQYSQAMHDVANALLENEIITGETVREAVERVRRTVDVPPAALPT
jgi:cell division protease FtsH